MSSNQQQKSIFRFPSNSELEIRDPEKIIWNV